jgi:hypothetical protein
MTKGIFTPEMGSTLKLAVTFDKKVTIGTNNDLNFGQVKSSVSAAPSQAKCE